MKKYALTLFFILATAVSGYGEAPPAPPQDPVPTDVESRISGQVMIKGKTPMVNGVVLLYNKEWGAPPHPYKYWRIPDLISGTDSRGKFSIVVAEGTYYLMIAQKKPNGEIGPPKESEFLYFHGDVKGNPKPIVVAAGANLNLGVLTRSFKWSPKLVQRDKDITAIEGVVADMEGKPVERAVVFAYFSKNAVGRPAFVSDRTDKNGRYQLRVYEGGTYYLKVRSVIGGGTPETGEYLSTTKSFEPLEVHLAKGQKLADVALKVDRFAGKGLPGVDKPVRIWKNTDRLQTK